MSSCDLQNTVLRLHQCYNILQWVLSKVKIMYYYKPMPHFLIHSPIKGQLGCFHILATACSTVVNMG